MTEKTSRIQIDRKKHKLQKISWPQHNEQYRQVDLLVPSFLKKEKALDKASSEFEDLLVDVLQFAREVLSVPGPQEIHIVEKKNQDEVGSFFIDEDRYPQMNLSQTWYNSVVQYVSSILTGEREPDDLMEFGENGTKKVFKKATGLLVGYIVSTIGHEMYHARQAYQDPEYYTQTVNGNWPYRFWSKWGEEKENPELAKRGRSSYNNSLGERSATGFSLRFFIEYKKKILSKEDCNRSSVEKLFLVGADETANALKQKIALMREKS